MVSPETHLVKNHESLAITNESQLKKNKDSCLGLYVTRQLIWRQMAKLFITEYSLRKLMPAWAKMIPYLRI